MDTTRQGVAYPAALQAAEEQLLKRRRSGALPSDRRDQPLVGVALSGGGIRSATFALGVFQSFAKRGLLDRIDYLSTVSGGGYFGSFLGRLFTRDYIASVGDVEGVLRGENLPNAGDPATPAGESRSQTWRVFHWLRENGRYLSPRGSGDLLLGLAALFRNWASVHVVLASFVLLVFVLLQGARVGVEGVGSRFWSTTIEPILCALPGSSVVWWSPFAPLAIAVFLGSAVPCGLAYWLARRRPAARPAGEPWPVSPLWALCFIVGVGVAAIFGDWLRPAWQLAVVVSVVIAALSVAVLKVTQYFIPKKTPDSSDDFVLAETRSRLSGALKVSLIVTSALIAFTLIDTVGQTGYLVAQSPESSLKTWVAGLLTALTGFAAFGRQLTFLFGGDGRDKRPSLPLSLVATTAAIVILTVVLAVLDGLSHAIAWNWLAPPATLPDLPAPRDLMYLIPIAGAILALLGLAWFFGHSWPFLNQSSHQQLYTARLRRAYLGASNESRMSGSPEAGLTENQAGDDLSMADYWRGSLGGPIAKGAPLHLINVTVNETVDGESQVQQQDRKGMGMALGPAAISLGVRHHVVWRDAPATRPSSYPPVEMVLPALAPDTPHLVFGGAVRDHAFSGEHLPLSNWVSISGAAFSTGIGSRTSLGLSLLCGFGNIRLGYWWNSGVPRRPGVQRRPGWISRGFPVQYYLLQEFIARFPGTAHQHWYLSDGGHFENMGGYELVRRRLPIMIIVDAEADPDYRFEGLANFIRKARLDFDAEIRFLTDEELDGLLGAWYDDTCRKETRDLRRQFGSLDLLRRGRWTKDAIRDPYDPAGNERRRLEEPVARTLLSVAHAALARVSYDGSKTPQSWLVYVKPTLGGNEPADLLQYHADKPDFPHETTSDQFFDEAQWESYRRLGEHIAAAVFGLPADVLPQLPQMADERRELADVLLMRRPESA